MKFCKSCKTVAHQRDESCPVCSKKLTEITDINEPVQLCVIGGTERAMLCGMLNDAGIPYQISNAHLEGMPNGIITGIDVKLSNVGILVPFQALPKASELLSAIETVRNPIEPMIDEITAHIAHLKTKTDNPDGKDSPARRTTIKVITAILFLLLVAAVVLGTDAFTGWIKGLFGG